MNHKDRLQISIDKELKDEVNAIIEQIGLTPTAVVNALYVQIKNLGEIPFKFKAQNQTNDLEALQKAFFEQNVTNYVVTPEEFAKMYDEKYGDYEW